MIRSLEVYVRRKLRKQFKFFEKKDRAALRNKDFVIISNNCWGGQVYQWYQLPYNTPFVGMFIYGPCYIKLLKNFDHYMAQELKFGAVSIYKDRAKTYPLGIFWKILKFILPITKVRKKPMKNGSAELPACSAI